MTALWPDLGDEDPHQRTLNATYNYLVADRQLNLKTGQWELLPLSTTRPLLRVVCDAGHGARPDPMLAELWRTDSGLFFISKLPGGLFDPPDDPTDPFAPPTAVLSKDQKVERRRQAGRARLTQGWQPVPITIVRLFLEDPNTLSVTLWVKCGRHGPHTIDRVRLYKTYLEDQRRRQQRDTPEPLVIGLHDVEALSSP
ncbi:hypothetical protein ACOCJ4_13575 [Knoellia sp. CPCC 206435]|uniref:hypothetical protein n=1 Tax=Knoellia terrae TaxID=3404797 RepID=UPI003B42FA4F